MVTDAEEVIEEEDELVSPSVVLTAIDVSSINAEDDVDGGADDETTSSGAPKTITQKYSKYSATDKMSFDKV